MSARIARGSSTGKGKKVSRASSKRRPQRGMVDALPLPAETVRKAGWLIFFGMAAAVLLALAVAFQLHSWAGIKIGEAVGEAGFSVRRIEPKGLDRMNPMQVYLVASDQLDRPMPLVELEETRERLLRYGWIREARVSRRWPDTLVIDVVEREPTAIWQHNQELTLIDDQGVLLEAVKLEAMPDLPLVVGARANLHAGQLARLLQATPELKPLLEGATWVGGRRWDVRFQSGEVLALPEGEERAKAALVQFARMDRMTQLLGRGLVRFDMRIPGKFIVRVSSRPGTSVADLAPPPPAPPTTASIDPATTI
jgi:cell division protein FtsQ